MLQLYFLGTPLVKLNQQPIKIGRRKAVALLAYLALRSHPISRDTLAALFWGDSDTERARASVRNTLWVLNEALGEGWLDVEQEHIHLLPSDNLWIDVSAFLKALESCGQHDHHPHEICTLCIPLLTEAVTLYRDDLLSGFTLRDSPEFENWLQRQSDGLRFQYSKVLERLIRAHSALEQFDTAMKYAQRWLRLDPYHDESQQAIMRLYAWTGQKAAAIQQYEQYLDFLEEELATEPLEATTQLYHQIAENQIPALPTIYYPPSERESLPQTPAAIYLPLQPTPFLGREEECQQIAALLEKADQRLITLVGLGGIGKTRLALQAAAQNAPQFSDGVFFVPLMTAVSRHDILLSIAQALDFSFYGTQEFEVQLFNYLNGKNLLLVLDNFEHLLEYVGLLFELSNAAPTVQMLVTSREPLGIEGEHLFEIGGLLVPDVATEKDYTVFASVRLFLESAQRVQIGYVPGSEDIHFIVYICRLLEGIPLAIEMAATWIRLLTPAEIAAEIEKDYDILASRSVTAPQRQRSLRATFDYSWGLLDEQEQIALRGLAVFSGGFSQEAAKSVAGANLLMLAALADKSLIRRNVQGRYEIHELIRQFVGEKLAAVPEIAAQIQQRRCDYIVNFLASRQAALKSDCQLETMDEILDEIGNVRAAWLWALDHQQLTRFEPALYSIYTVFVAWNWHQELYQLFGQAIQKLEARANITFLGHLLAYQSHLALRSKHIAEARLFAERSLEYLKDQPGISLILVYRTMGFLTMEQGQYEESLRYFEQAIAISEQLGDDWSRAYTLREMAMAAAETGHYDEADQFLKRSVALFRQSNAPLGQLHALQELLGLMIRQQHFDSAQVYADQVMELCHQIGSKRDQALLYTALGVIQFYGTLNYDETDRWWAKAQALFEEIGDLRNIGIALSNRAAVLGMLEKHEEAELVAEQSLVAFEKLGDTPRMIDTLVNLGSALKGQKKYERAEVMLKEALQRAALPQNAFSAMYAHANLGELYALTSKYDLMMQHYLAALELGIQHEYTASTLENALDFSRMLELIGKAEQAYELLWLVRRHAEYSEALEEHYKDLPPKLDEQLSAEKRRSIEAKLADLKLEDYVRELQEKASPR